MNIKRLKEMMHDYIEVETRRTGDKFVLRRFRSLVKTFQPALWNEATTSVRNVMEDQLKNIATRLIHESATNQEPLFSFIVAPVVEAAFAFEERLKTEEPLLLGPITNKQQPENYARSYVYPIGHANGGCYVGLYLARHRNGELAAEYINLQRRKGNGLVNNADERAEGWAAQNLLSDGSLKIALAAEEEKEKEKEEKENK